MRRPRHWLIRALEPLATLVLVTIALLSVLLMAGLPSAQSYLPNPLAPPDTASPRATLTSLQAEVDAAEKLMRATYARHIKEPGFFMSKQTEEAQDLIRAHLELAMRTLDLSEVPPANRYKTALETTMLLEEIFDRVGLPNPGAIPDAPMMKALVDKGERQQWTVPQTEIRIARVEKGAHAGEYLFTPDSVSRAYEFYQRVRAIAPPDGFDFYSFYALSPGELVPPKWYAYIQKLPPWYHEVYIDSAHWQWLALGLTLLIALSVCYAIHRMVRPGRFLAARLPHWLNTLVLPLSVLIAISLASSFIDLLNFTGPVQRIIATSFDVVLYLPLAWLAVVVCNRMADWVSSAWSAQRYSFDTGIVRVAIRIVGIFTATALLTYGANQIGVPLVGILAGLGVGGLAVALAAQPTIENFIGGIMIYADRPVRVGDYGKFGSVTGMVEEIGIRSTRIRQLDRSILTVPNSEFSKAQITNYSNRDRLVFTTTIGLAYGTKEKQLRAILKKMRAMLTAHPRVNPDKVGVRFAGFGDQSLLVAIVAELAHTGNDELHTVSEDLNLHMFNVVEKSGAELAVRTA